MPSTKYNIVECGDDKIVIQCDSDGEAFSVIQTLIDCNPGKSYEVKEIVVYDKDAFRLGRNPELH